MGHKEEVISSIKVECCTLQKLLSEYKLTEVDYLQVDTEGHDAKILNCCDFSIFSVKQIEFEYIHLSEVEIKYLKERLENFGYKTIKITNEDVILNKD